MQRPNHQAPRPTRRPVSERQWASARQGGLPDTLEPLYERVRHELMRMALEAPLSDSEPLPPEPRLMERFGVSRGTLRRAIDEMARDGLLSVEQGRGTFVNQEERARRVVWERLAEVARPDSRFDMDLKHFVPDFSDRSKADRAVRGQPAWTAARTVFIAPDNSTEDLRRQAMAEGKRLLVPTYGLRRGFVRIEGAAIAEADRAMAATLDGMERFGKRIGPADLRSVGRVELVVTGATAVTTDGRHIGGGQRYLAMEWALLVEQGLVDDRVPVVAVVHDCQVIDERIEADPDCMVDTIVTPTRVIQCSAGGTITALRGRRK